MKTLIDWLKIDVNRELVPQHVNLLIQKTTRRQLLLLLMMVMMKVIEQILFFRTIFIEGVN